MLRRLSQLLVAAGLLGTAAALLLSHLAETRMGVMRDLYMRNESFSIVLDSLFIYWSLRVLVGCGLLFFVRSIGRAPLSAVTGLFTAISWLAISFSPELFGLASPWMLTALSVLFLGCAGMVAATVPPRQAKRSWEYPDS